MTPKCDSCGKDVTAATIYTAEQMRGLAESGYRPEPDVWEKAKQYRPCTCGKCPSSTWDNFIEFWLDIVRRAGTAWILCDGCTLRALAIRSDIEGEKKTGQEIMEAVREQPPDILVIPISLSQKPATKPFTNPGVARGKRKPKFDPRVN